jgi:DNA-binding Lrp family transcriptional regulator
LQTVETPQALISSLCQGLSVDCIELLMRLQYDFPLTKTPFLDLAASMGVGSAELFDAVRKLKEAGIVKRVGFYYNARASRKAVALIAFNVNEPEKLAREAARKLEVTHNYLRECKRYNLWIVARASSEDVLRKAVAKLAGKYSASWSILWAVRTYRLSVKYDLHRGVSRAGYLRELPLNPPSPEELGFSRELAHALRSLPLSERPYAVIGEKLGYSEDEVYNAMRLMLGKGILADPGAAIDGRRIGFRVNVMYTLKPRAGVTYEELCSWVARNVEEATHIVLRRAEPDGSWEHLCYFMAHAVSEKALESLDDKLSSSQLVGDFLKLRSLRDFMPGVVR